MKNNEYLNVHLSQQDIYKMQSNGVVTIFTPDGDEIKLQIEWNSAVSTAEKETL